MSVVAWTEKRAKSAEVRMNRRPRKPARCPKSPRKSWKATSAVTTDAASEIHLPDSKWSPVTGNMSARKSG